MLRIKTASLAVLAVGVAPLLVSCASEATGSSDSSAEQVPAGVVEQYETLEAEVAARGGQTTSGDWTVSYIVEAAEPWFEPHGKHAMYRDPKQGETHHIEIIPTEKATGRIIPDVPITLEVIDGEGKVVDKQKLNFYYSTFFHYANNFHIPAEGDYTMRATLGTPAFNQHGEEGDGPAISGGTTVEFTGVTLAGS